MSFRPYRLSISRILLCASAWGSLLFLSTPAGAEEPFSVEQVKFFENEIRPLLVTRCYKCHGEESQKSGLRLDSREAVLAGGDSGPAIELDKPEDSLLLLAVNYEDFEMPPDGQLPEEEIALLTKWVEMGAPWPAGEGPAVVIRPKKAAITPEDQEHWSFRPVAPVEPPAVADEGWSRNEIDRFIWAKLAEAELRPAPEADRISLVRRAYQTLWGLPPTPEQVAAFVNDPSSHAYEELIDRLLDSPRYGEHWARHWLDLVRYAESDGYRQDAYRPNAWKYRDYVVRAFNSDKPYDRFVLEQLAGDEISPRSAEGIAATGFLRLGIYEYNQRDVRTQWDGMVDDVTNVTSDVFLGLGMGCARCHNHKFDPILQDDYFRLRSFFAGLRLVDDLPLADAAEWREYREKLSAWESKTAAIRAELAELEEPIRQAAARPHIEKFPPDIRVMMRKPAAEREPLEQQLVELGWRQVGPDLESIEFDKKLKGAKLERWQSLQAELKQFDALKPAPLPAAFAATDIGRLPPSTTIPGDRQKRVIPPGFLTVLQPQLQTSVLEIEPRSSYALAIGDEPNSSGRRTRLAEWITRPEHPLTPRVMVNRLWQQHFGVGLVETASDFGRLGDRPSHPELLDWLATRFVAEGWRLKPLHKLLLTSAAFRQSSRSPEDAVARQVDPTNRLLWRYTPRRLTADQIRDAMLFASGELQLGEFGAPVPPSTPRRTIYTRVERNKQDPLLTAFDAPDGFLGVSQRNTTTTPSQSLLMLNGPWVLARAKALAGRLRKEAGGDSLAAVERLWRLAYGREPSPVERASALAFLEEQPPAEMPPREFTLGEMPGAGGTALNLRDDPRDPLPQASPWPSAGDAGLTIEAEVHLRTLYNDASVRTIASSWNGAHTTGGWSLGVTSKASKYTPRNLILQVVGETGGGLQYEVIPSGLLLELERTYAVAAVIEPASKEKPGAVRFYARDLSTPEGEVRTARVEHPFRGGFGGTGRLTVGGRLGAASHRWNGWLRNLRIAQAPLPAEQLLLQSEALAPSSDQLLAHWPVADAAAPGSDASGRQRPLSALPDPVPSSNTALVDLCHVLLNSSEFLYCE